VTSPYEMHRNSQKRIILEDSIYFITTNTFNSYPYLKDYRFCDVLKAVIHLTQELKKIQLFAYKINPDHIHIMLKPSAENNVSEIMRSLKTNSSRNINRLINYNPEKQLKKFKWQKSFNDHIIRDDTDFANHIEYIKKQWIKHKLSENKYFYLDDELCGRYLRSNE
jgi:putative transposase